jgi:hypothetical protein
MQVQFWGCAYRKSHPAILMVQSAQDRASDDIPSPLNAARKRGMAFPKSTRAGFEGVTMSRHA